jgi:hypothetical protein
MRHLLTSLALLATFAAAGQTANPFPYNPDADADGWISVNDLLSLLAIFTSEFTPESWETDSLSAGVVLNGNLAYFECQNSCHQLEGHWRMADIDAFGRHWGLVSGNSSEFWVNRNSDIEQSQHVLSVNGQTGRLATVDFYGMNYDLKCMCHLQSSPFVPDVLTSETAGLQEQIDSLYAQQSILTNTLAAIDSLAPASSGSSPLSIECIEYGMAPQCSPQGGYCESVQLSMDSDGRFGISAGCASQFNPEACVLPNWRKFMITGDDISEISKLFVHQVCDGYSGSGGNTYPSMRCETEIPFEVINDSTITFYAGYLLGDSDLSGLSIYNGSNSSWHRYNPLSMIIGNDHRYLPFGIKF